MNKHEQSTPEFGLLANGSSGRWTIDVDESLDSEEWTLQIEGPQVYLDFQLDNLSILRQVLDFLQSELELYRTSQPRIPAPNEDTLTLGHFGSEYVSIIMDNEDFPRCFLVVGSQARSTFRVSLHVEDIQSLIEAFEQVVADIPEGAEK